MLTYRDLKTLMKSEEALVHEVNNSISESDPISNEEYIYDENYKMYYCVSTGYYYDRNTGLYYVPQNGAYYSYDYSKNAYVLYDENQPMIDYSREDDPNVEQPTIDLNKKENADDLSRTDDSCNSVVDEVNNLSISDTIAANQEINSHLAVEDHTNDIPDSNAENKLEFQENKTLKNFTEDWQTPEGSSLTVQDLVRNVAEQNCGMSDYIYDKNSGMYYSPSTGYYYDRVRSLLYDPQSGIYYKHDQESSSYEFYYKIDLSSTYNNKEIKEKKNAKERRKYWRKKQNYSNKTKTFLEQDENFKTEDYSSPEEGELFSSDSEEELKIQAQAHSHSENTSIICPPCIRAIVKSSTKLKTGTLILITCTGALIGKDKSNTVFIPDTGVSKLHAEVKFNEEIWKYYIKDLGSQNGTLVNNSRISQSKEHSQPHILNHGDSISIGSCELIFHIHVGYETCDECEPGLIMAELPAKQVVPSSIFKTKEEKEKERRQEVRRLKKKYGLEGMGYEEKKCPVVTSGSTYQDKSEIRRQTIGSENPYEKTEVCSLESAMNQSNKGYQMLKKLGWKEGDSLGVTGLGISEPIPFRPWLSKAGLGCSEKQQASMILQPANKRNTKWVKAQERFAKCDNTPV